MKFLAAVAVLAAGACAYYNPVVDSDNPDPGVIFHDGKFWMASTNNDVPAFPLRSSTDLVNWTTEGVIFPADNYPTWASTNYWAPEFHVVNGHLNIYFTARHGAQNLLSIGVATAESMTGPWKATDQPLVIRDVDILDCTVAQDRDTKKYYLIYKYCGNNSPFVAVELSEDGLSTVGESREILWLDLPWEGPLIEGPFFVDYNGYYYLFYSGNGYTDATYALGVARSKSLFGPYEKTPVPIFAQGADGAPGHTFTATGHGSVVQIPGTDVWYGVNHAYYSGRILQTGRVCIVDRMWWTADGWPIMGQARSAGEGDLPLPTSPEAAAMQPDLRIRDDGSLFTLEAYQGYGCVLSDGTINGDCSASRLRARTGFMGPRSISIESVDMPGHFMRHRDGEIFFDPDDGSDLFKQDATFFDVAGIRDPSMVSIRPYNYPNNFIRHKDGKLRFDPFDQTTLMAEDATFKIHYV